MTAEDSADLESLGRYIRSRRQALGLTQTQLGDRLGWLQERVSILENGKYGMPSLPALARLAIACEVPLSDVLAAAGYTDTVGARDSSTTADQPNGVALLYTVQELLAIDAGTMKDSLDQAADLVAGVMGAGKVDAFMFEPSTQSLVVIGSSNTEMGRKQHHLGMDRLPIANRGREVGVFETGQVYLTGDAKNDDAMLIGVKEGLNVQSFLAVPLSVGGARRGVVVAVSSQPDQFHFEDIRFFETVARWVGMVAHHAELMESLQVEAVETARRASAEELITYVVRVSQRHIARLRRHVMALEADLTQGVQGHSSNEVQSALEAIEQFERSMAVLKEASDLENSVQPLVLEWCDIGELVREVGEKHRYASSEVHVRSPEGVSVLVDYSRMKESLDAIVSNAIRRSPRGVPVIVNVSTSNHEDGPWFTISVQDEGAAVDAQSVHHLFHHFGPATGDVPPGLYLYLARSTAEAHGGTLTVESPGLKGCIFHLSVPLLTSRANR